MAEQIDTRLPYRIGCPNLPVLPVQTTIHHLEDIPNFDNHQGNIQNVLAEYDIPQHGMAHTHRYNDGTDTPDRCPTLSIISQYEDGCQDRWVKAVKEIRTMLVQSGIYLAIELIDKDVWAGKLRTSPILSTDRDLIEGWSKVLPDFLATIENHNWVAIDVLHRDFPSREMQPTVMISAQDANNDDWWNTTLPTLHQLLKANNVKVDITLRYSKGINLVTTQTGIKSDIWDTAYRDEIYIGASCSASGSTTSGTLGCGIKLQSGSSVLELGLSNYHIFRDAYQDQGSISGPLPPGLGRPYGTVVSPSDRDYKVKVDGITDMLGEQVNYDARLSKKLVSLTEDNPSWKKTVDCESRARRQVDFSCANLCDVVGFPRHVGELYAASGFRTAQNPRYGLSDWALDWCLFRVDQPKSISHQVPFVPATAHHIPNNADVTQYCTINAARNYEVMKRGRTTGWTKGTISAIESVVRPELHPELSPKTPTNHEEQFNDKWGGRHVFVHPIIGTREVPQFIEPGDSGSIILLDQASHIPGVFIAGLGFAVNDETYVSYMMPMDLIVEDIEQVTGAKVIEPVHVGAV